LIVVDDVNDLAACQASLLSGRGHVKPMIPHIGSGVLMTGGGTSPSSFAQVLWITTEAFFARNRKILERCADTRMSLAADADCTRLAPPWSKMLQTVPDRGCTGGAEGPPGDPERAFRLWSVRSGQHRASLAGKRDVTESFRARRKRSSYLGESRSPLPVPQNPRRAVRPRMVSISHAGPPSSPRGSATGYGRRGPFTGGERMAANIPHSR
jgi:hypothetical protein